MAQFGQKSIKQQTQELGYKIRKAGTIAKKSAPAVKPIACSCGKILDGFDALIQSSFNTELCETCYGETQQGTKINI